MTLKRLGAQSFLELESARRLLSKSFLAAMLDAPRNLGVSNYPFAEIYTHASDQKAQFKLGKLRVKDKTAPEIWNAILAA